MWIISVDITLSSVYRLWEMFRKVNDIHCNGVPTEILPHSHIVTHTHTHTHTHYYNLLLHLLGHQKLGSGFNILCLMEQPLHQHVKSKLLGVCFASGEIFENDILYRYVCNIGIQS